MTSILDGLSYIRGPALFVLGSVHTVVHSIVVILVAFLVRSLRAVDFVIVQMWARPLLWISGIDLEVRGRENVATHGKGFLILFNHSSHMDIPVLFCFPRSFRYGAKIELFKIPFFGRAMKAVGVLPIDRGNRHKVMQVYEGAISRVEKGECFALAPEGTRQSEPKIGAFKRGPFEFAINAHMDIVPVVITGAYEVLPKKTLWINMGKWRRKVILEILPRVHTANFSSDQVDGLMKTVHDEMEHAFLKNHAEIS